MLEDTLAAALRTLGEEDGRAQLAFALIGKAYQGLGLAGEALHYYRQARDLAERFQPDEELALLCTALYADCQTDLGRYREAEMTLEALEGKAQVSGSEHLDTIRQFLVKLRQTRTKLVKNRP